MKKLLFSFVFASGFATSFGQQQFVDFESLPLAQADTFYNGADNAGLFSVNTSQNVVDFSNYFGTSQWGDYWGGFGYSNRIDMQTAGIDNQFSAYAGSGSNQSEKFAVYYPDGTISFANKVIVDSIKLSNNTYAALSMLNGDSFGKKFGSTTGADGMDDGTNGEDFFRVWIIGLDEQNQKIDSIEFYLADFRGTAAYILNTWENVDLSSLGEVKSLDFRFESSDMSFGYINTPTYFIMDDLYFTNTLSVSEINSTAIQVYPNPVVNSLTINGLSGNLILKNVEGKVIYEKNHNTNSNIDFSKFNSGIYFLSIETEAGTITQKVVK